MKRLARTESELEVSELLFECDPVGIIYGKDQMSDYDIYAVDCVRFYTSFARMAPDPPEVLAIFLSKNFSTYFSETVSPMYTNPDLKRLCADIIEVIKRSDN